MKWLRVYSPGNTKLLNIEKTPWVNFTDLGVTFGEDCQVTRAQIESGHSHFEYTKSKDWETVKKLLLMHLEGI